MKWRAMPSPKRQVIQLRKSGGSAAPSDGHVGVDVSFQAFVGVVERQVAQAVLERILHVTAAVVDLRVAPGLDGFLEDREHLGEHASIARVQDVPPATS
jgi:hypothetical protein